MNSRLLFASFLSVGLLFCSCEKRYKYVEKVRETDVFGNVSTKQEEPVTIKAATDTAAYISAYTKFSAAKGTYQNLSERGMPYLKKPLSFKLYDPKGNDITDIDFVTKSEKEQKIDEIVSKIGK